MVNQKIFRPFIIFIMILFIASCNFPGMSGVQSGLDQNQIFTAAAKTIQTTLTLGALAESLNQTLVVNTPSLQTSTPTSSQAAVPPSNTPNIMPTDTPTPSNTPLPLITLTPTEPLIHATVNTNCRLGPGSTYDVVAFLLVGDYVKVYGRNSNNTWWYIQNPDNLAKYCWVWTQSTVVEGNMSIIPVVTPVATVTPSVAVITLSSSASPTSYTGPCPVNIVLTGKIKSSLPVDVTYNWAANFSYPFVAQDFSFDVAGSETFTKTISISSTTVGYVRFRVYSPYEVKADRIDLVINCVP
jgi:hypothetical protein